jgi:hypothetical protein
VEHCELPKASDIEFVNALRTLLERRMKEPAISAREMDRRIDRMLKKKRREILGR